MTLAFALAVTISFHPSLFRSAVSISRIPPAKIVVGIISGFENIPPVFLRRPISGPADPKPLLPYSISGSLSFSISQSLMLDL